MCLRPSFTDLQSLSGGGLGGHVEPVLGESMRIQHCRIARLFITGITGIKAWKPLLRFY